MHLFTRLFIFIGGNLLFNSSLYSAVTLKISPPTLSVQPGQVVTMNVTVEGFTDVAAYQFSMTWDPAVLQFQSIGYNLAGLSASHFNTTQTSSGQLSTAFVPSSAISLPDGASLFSLQFLAVGAAGASTDLAFGNVPTAIAFYNSAVQPLNVATQAGQLGLGSASAFSVSGNVRRNSGVAVPGATVLMTGTSTGTDLTNSAGNYLFPNLAAGSNLTLTPVKSNAFSECVSVRDILFILKHILGLQALGSPYQMIEADVNKSNTITGFDIVELRKLILGIHTEFPSNDSWRFVPADFAFANPLNPFQTGFPEVSDLSNLQADAVRDFIGMKIGDATDCVGDAHGPAFLTLSAPNLSANVGDNIFFSITCQGFTNVSGLQFTMSWDPAVLQFNGINSSIPNWSGSNYAVSGGHLSVCWNDLAPLSFSDGTPVLSLNFTVIASTNAVSPLAFTESPTRSEVVDGMCNPFDLNHADGSVTVYCPLCTDSAICGRAVITCFSGQFQNPPYQNSNGYVVGMYDVRNHAGHFDGTNWSAAAGGGIHAPDWKSNRMGEVFGLTTSKDHFYVAATSVYGLFPPGPAGAAGVYRVNAHNFSVTDLVTTGAYAQGLNQIPNTGSGMGDICYDPDHDQLFATNHADGMIYRIHASNGQVLSRFDPFSSTNAPDPVDNQFVALGERLWAIAYNPAEKRVFFSRWNEHQLSPPNTIYNEIHSIGLTASGEFAGNTTLGDGTVVDGEILEKELTEFATPFYFQGNPNPIYDNSNPVSDIAFSADGKRMLTSQRTMSGNYAVNPYVNIFNWAHNATVLEYERSPNGSWQLTPGHDLPYTTPTSNLKFEVGGHEIYGTGGVDYGYKSFNPASAPNGDCDEMVWATMDNINNVFGIQGMMSSGGGPNTSVLVDADNILDFDKTILGDVEIFKCGCPKDSIPADTCCQNQQAFLDKAAQGFHSTHQKCGISVTPKALDDCQRVTYTWGDGSTTGPLTSNTTTGHIYSEPGYYTVCAKIEELNSTGAVCFSSDTCWSICAVCDTCKNPLAKSEWAKAPYEWQNYNGGTTQFDMYADAQGDFYVTGNHTVPTKGEDGFVAKYKSDGTLAWDFSFGGADADKGNLINNNPLDGGFYLAGKFRSTSFDLPSFGSSSPVSLSLTGTAPRSDVFLARYDADRNLIWAFTLGGVWDDQMDGMAVDGSGNVYVAGAMRAEVNFNPLGPSQILTPPVYAPFVAKYHPDGQLEWVRYLYDPTKVQCGANLGLALDADANVYVGGEFYGTPHWEGWPTPSPLPALAITTNVPSTSNSTGVPYVAKLKSNGDFVWAFDLQDLAKDKSGAIQDVEVKDNYLYITGGAVANANINFAPLGGAPILQAPRPSGNFIARYNLQGQAQKGFALPLLYAVDELEISANDQVYAAGYVDGTNNPRMLVNIFDADLNLTKSLQTGSGGAPIDIASSVAPDLFGSFGVAGSFKSQQFDADPQTGNGFEFPAFTNGLSHVFIGKYACDCPGEPINPCGPCDSIAATLVHKPSQQGCCAAIKIQNQLPNYFSAIQFNVLSGGSLLVSDVTPSVGWQISGFVSGVSVAVKPAGGGSIPVGNNPCAFVCMSKLSANDQYIEVEYLSANGETVCRDTLHFVCNYCAQIRVDSVSCEDGGQRKVTFCVKIDPDLGWNASSIALMPMPGVTFSPASFPLPSVPPGGLHCYLTTFVSFAPGARTDSLCIPFTLHEADVTQGLPPLLCCMGKQCIALPDCLCDPDITYATQQKGDFGEGQCCWDITLHQMAGMIFGVQTNILTPGVNFQAVAPSSSWDFMLRSPQSLVWTPDGGGTLPATLPLPTLCLDVPKGSPSPQVLEIVWLSTDSSICRQRLEFNCTSLDTNCAALTPKSLGCSQPLPGHNIYTVTVTNPFNSTSTIVPNHIAVVAVTPSGALLGNGIFPVGDLLPGHSTDIQIPLQGATGTKVCFKLNLYRKTNPDIYEECCVTPDTFCVVLKNCGQANSPLSIAFYPNPTKGHVTLDFGAVGSPANGLVRIRDLAGRLLREEVVPPGSWTHEILLPDLASGLYLTEFVENNTRLWVGKMSVLR